jgi:protein SCO1/2
MTREALAVLLMLAVLSGGAPRALPATPPATHILADAARVARPTAPRLTQHPGARLPLDTAFVDDAGRKVTLGRYFAGGPVLLVLGYYHCPNLCSTVMDGLLQSVSALDLRPASLRVLGVSIDPAENAAVAARKKAGYLPLLAGSGVKLDLLTGALPAIRRLAAATGFGYVYDSLNRQYLHPAGFLVATGDGRISRYFPDVGVQVRDLRLALVQASDGAIGSVSDRFVLLCSHFDPLTGRYTGLVWGIVRMVCVTVLLLLASCVWLLRRRERMRA